MVENNDIPVLGLNQNPVDNIEMALKEAENAAKQTETLDMEVSKAVIEKALAESHMESTTNLNRREIRRQIHMMVLYTITRNPRLKIYIIGTFKMNKSLTNEPTNLLESLFSLGKNARNNEQSVSERLESMLTGK